MASIKGNALIIESELEELLQTTFETEYANALINMASQFIENFCDRLFIETTYTKEIYNGNGTHELYLKNYPLSDIGSLIIVSWDTYNDKEDYVFTINTDYLIYTNEGMLYHRWGWIKGHQNYRVTYKAGYAIAAIPYDLKQACAQICQYINNHKNNPGAISEAMGKYSISYSNPAGGKGISVAIPAAIIDLLQPYRRISFGEL